jgi:acetolactate decarboxylase
MEGRVSGSGNLRQWFSSGRGAALLAVFAALLVLAVTALMIAVHAAGGAPTGAAVPVGRDTLWQVSTYGALAGGDFAGTVELRRLPARGAVGLGTFTGLNGEMVVLDGRIYQARSDGRVVRPGPLRRTPFACVTHFEADRSARLSRLTGYPALQAALDGLRGSDDDFYAFRVHGTFARLKIRTVPMQDEPYPDLADALREQIVTEAADVRGTLVGFWCPARAAKVNVPGYHLHFVSDDRRTAGHVLDVDVAAALAAADRTTTLRLARPGSAVFADTPL